MKYILLFFTLLFVSCSSTEEKAKEFQVGITHIELGMHHYKIISTGKASEDSIESEDLFKRKITSCQAAKDMYQKRISFLEKEQKYRDFFINVISQKNSIDNIYCEYVIEYKIPSSEPKN